MALTIIFGLLAACAAWLCWRLSRCNDSLRSENRDLFHRLVHRPDVVEYMEHNSADLDRQYCLCYGIGYVSVAMRVPYKASDGGDIPTYYAFVPVKSFPCGDDPDYANMLAEELCAKLEER